MNSEETSANQLARLQKETQRLAISAHLLAAAVIVGLTAGCLSVLWLVPRFKELLAGLGGGTPLPSLTIIVFDSRLVLGLASLSIGATGLIMCFCMKRTHVSLLLACATVLALFILLAAMTAACLLPAIQLCNELGNGPQ